MDEVEKALTKKLDEATKKCEVAEEAYANAEAEGEKIINQAREERDRIMDKAMEDRKRFTQSAREARREARGEVKRIDESLRKYRGEPMNDRPKREPNSTNGRPPQATMDAVLEVARKIAHGEIPEEAGRWPDGAFTQTSIDRHLPGYSTVTIGPALEWHRREGRMRKGKAVKGGGRLMHLLPAGEK